MSKRTLYIILVAHIALLIGCVLFLPSAPHASKSVSTSDSIAQRIDLADADLKEKLASLSVKEQQLKTEIALKTDQLKASQQSVQSLRSRIKSLIVLDNTSDTTSDLTPCDSLKHMTLALIDQSERQDSLQEQETTALQELLDVKDSTISTLTAGYIEMKQLADRSVTAQKTLETKLAKAEKKLKRAGKVKAVLASAACVIAGFTLSILAR